MYVGYGLSYAVGIYVTAADIFGMVSAVNCLETWFTLVHAELLT